MRRINKRALAVGAIIFALLVGGIIYTAASSGSSTESFVDLREEQARLQAQAEGLDSQLGVVVAAPDEVDLGDPVSVVAAGIRMGKAVMVNATEVTVKLQDRAGFTMGLREYAPGASDPNSSVVKAYNGVYLTNFPALETQGSYVIRVEMSYLAPWGEEISGFTEKSLSVQDWFNISSILQRQKEATQETITSVMGGAADIIRDLSDKVSGVASGIGQISSLVANFGENGLIDPAEMTFFPLLLEDFETQADMEYGSGEVRYATPEGVSDPRPLDPQANFQSFVDSLDVLVEKGIPFEAYTLRDIGDLKAFSAGQNWTGSPAVSDENPLASGHYLSFDPDEHDASEWVDGQGRGTGSAGSFDLMGRLPYRNILLNTYESWFPISESWTDYTNFGDSEPVAYNAGETGPWNASRWIKQIAAGLDRNFSLFYNIKGEPFRNFFNADPLKSFENYNPEFDDEWGSESGQAFSRLNDFALFTYNEQRNLTTDPIDPDTREGAGGFLDTVQVYPYESGQDPSLYAALTGLEKGGDWVGSFFGGREFPGFRPVENYSFAVLDEYATSSAYEVGELYASASGMVLSPGIGFGYSSLRNTTLGLTMLHGLYYKIVGDAVIEAKVRLDEASENLGAEHPSIAADIASLRQEILDGWYGTPEEDYQNRYDLPRINDALMEIQHQFLTGWANNTAENIEGDSEGIEGAALNASEEAVETDEKLAQAGSDIHFGLFGDIAKAAGGFLKNAAGAVLNLGGAALNGITGLGRLITGDADGAMNDWGRAGSHLVGVGGHAIGMFKHAAKGVSSVVKAFVKHAVEAVLQFIKTRFSTIGNIIDQIRQFRKDVCEAITKVLDIIQSLINKTAQALDWVANTIENISAFINDFVGTVYDKLIEHTNNIQESLQNIKSEVLQSTGFYFKIRDSMYKMIERSEFASGILRYASEEFGVTEEVFFKEVDVLRPMALLQSGDSGLYAVQLGGEAIDQVVYVTMYRGRLVNVDDIEATYQAPSSSPIQMNITKRVHKGIYAADFGLATERDWMTRCDITYTNDDGDEIDAFTVRRTSKVEPSLQEDAYPEIVFDAGAVELKTGESYRLHIGVRNLMYSEPRVTVRAELVGGLGNLVGLREEMLTLNAEGENDQFIDLSAQIPFYVPPGQYDLTVKVVEDNGDVTRVSYKVKVSADNFIMGLLGGLLSALGLGVAGFVFKRRRGSKRSPDLGSLALPVRGGSSGKCPELGCEGPECPPECRI
jgi:hypothetical protein